MTRIFDRRALLLASAAMASGCAGGLLPKPAAAPRRYTLGDPPDDTAAAPTAPAGVPSLVVAPPGAAPGFDSPRMVYLRQAQAPQAYAYAEWVDTPARLLAPLLVRALQRTGAFHAVLQAPSSANAVLRLETELLRLQHEHTTSPSEVRLGLRAVLVNTATRQPLAAREFELRVPAASDDPAGGVAAAGVATRQLLAALAAYVASFASSTRREP